MGTIGILALQGAFAKHQQILKTLDVCAKLITKPIHLKACDGLIIPGGESTTISRALDFSKMREAIVDFAEEKPIFGTCAGLILMAKNYFGFLDIDVNRNGFGRQYESFSANVTLNFTKNPFKAVFIRAPRIQSVGKEVEIIATHNDEPVLVKQNNFLAATFHPELTFDTVIHEFFLTMI